MRIQHLLHRTSLFLVVFALQSAAPADAGTIFLSGDSNIVNPLVGSGDPGNKQFFQNILQGGSTVLVYGEFIGSGSLANLHGNVNAFYNTLSGVSSTIFTGTVTSASLSGVDLFVSFLPNDEFTDSEIIAMGGLLTGGGSIFFMGENVVAFMENARINTVIAALGTKMSIINAELDPFDEGFSTATGLQIANDSFTTGVDTFTYVLTSEVNTSSGGTPLFFTSESSGSKTFLAYETVSGEIIPEPSSIVLLGMGALSLIGFRCRRKRKPVA